MSVFEINQLGRDDDRLDPSAYAIRAEQHEHRYVFLRQEKRNIGYDRNPTWSYIDIYFCESCLGYREVEVRRTQPDRTSFDREHEVWRLR